MRSIWICFHQCPTLALFQLYKTGCSVGSLSFFVLLLMATLSHFQLSVVVLSYLRLSDWDYFPSHLFNRTHSSQNWAFPVSWSIFIHRAKLRTRSTYVPSSLNWLTSFSLLLKYLPLSYINTLCINSDLQCLLFPNYQRHSFYSNRFLAQP